MNTKNILIIVGVIIALFISFFVVHGMTFSVADLGKWCVNTANDQCYQISSSYDNCQPLYNTESECNNANSGTMICTPDTTRCVGNLQYYCNPDGMSEIETDCTDFADTCGFDPDFGEYTCIMESCTPIWSCPSWSTIRTNQGCKNGELTRECVDSTDCTTNKKVETRPCCNYDNVCQEGTELCNCPDCSDSSLCSNDCDFNCISDGICVTGCEARQDVCDSDPDCGTPPPCKPVWQCPSWNTISCGFFTGYKKRECIDTKGCNVQSCADFQVTCGEGETIKDGIKTQKTPCCNNDGICQSGIENCNCADCSSDPLCNEEQCEFVCEEDGICVTGCETRLDICGGDADCGELEDCDDKKDNDGDGLVDCKDEDCKDFNVCKPTQCGCWIDAPVGSKCILSDLWCKLKEWWQKQVKLLAIIISGLTFLFTLIFMNITTKEWELEPRWLYIILPTVVLTVLMYFLITWFWWMILGAVVLYLAFPTILALIRR